MGRCTLVALGLLLLGLVAAAPLPAQEVTDSQAWLQAARPFVNEDTIAVARVDLARLNPTALASYARERGLWPEKFQAASDSAAAAAKAGLRDVFLIVSAKEGLEVSEEGVLAFAPLPAGVDGETLLAALQQTPAPPHLPWGESGAPFLWGGGVVFGPQGARERLADFIPAERPDFRAALQAAGTTDLQIVLIPTPAIRKTIGDLKFPLPPNLLKALHTLGNEAEWIAFTANLPPHQAAGLFVEMKTAAAANLVRDGAKTALDILSQMDHVQGLEFPRLQSRLLPKLQGLQLRATLTRQDGSFDAALAAFGLTARPPAKAEQ